MPRQKTLFEQDEGINLLTITVNKLNQAMAGVSNVKTVEDLQAFINNLNRVYAEIRQLTANV